MKLNALSSATGDVVIGKRSVAVRFIARSETDQVPGPLILNVCVSLAPGEMTCVNTGYSVPR